MAIHSFDTEIAENVGIPAAIIFRNIQFWVEKNQANKKHFYDGKYWAYSSVEAFQTLFPYMGAKTIRNAIEKLKTQGYIVDGNYNKSAYDRTKWYALGSIPFAQKENSICPKGQMENAERANGICQKGEPIPDSKQYSKPDRNTDNPPYNPPKGETAFSRFWKEYPKKVAKSECEKWFNKHKPDEPTVDSMIASINFLKASEQWQRDNGQYIPNPSTYLNQKRWEDEDCQPPKPKPKKIHISNQDEITWQQRFDDPNIDRVIGYILVPKDTPVSDNVIGLSEAKQLQSAGKGEVVLYVGGS